MLCLWVSSDPARSESLEIKVPLSLLQQNQVSDSKKKKCNSTFLSKNWVKSKWNPFVSRLNANKHDPTLHVVKLQHIPRSEAGLLESECKWKCISSIYIGQVPTPGTTSSGSGEAGLCLSVFTLSTSASLFPTRQCEHVLLLLRELTDSKWLCKSLQSRQYNPSAHFITGANEDDGAVWRPYSERIYEPKSMQTSEKTVPCCSKHSNGEWRFYFPFLWITMTLIGWYSGGL